MTADGYPWKLTILRIYTFTSVFGLLILCFLYSMNSRWLVGSEDTVESIVAQGMRVSARNSESKQVDNIDDSDPDVGKVLTEELGGMEHFDGCLITAANEDDIWVLSLVS